MKAFATTSILNHKALAISAAVAAALAVNADAAPLYWDNSDTAGLQAGPGVWDATGGTNWSETDTAVDPRVPWTQGSDANFITNGLYTVTVAGAVHANSLTLANWAGPTVVGEPGDGADSLTIGTGGMSHTGSNPLNLNLDVLLDGSQTWHATHASQGIVVNGAIGQTAAGYGLTKTGDGRAVLGGNNGYTGATVISAGTLQIGNGGTTGSLQSSSIALNSGRLIFNSTGNHTYNGNITGAAVTTSWANKEGTGTLTLSGTNAFNGGASVQGRGGLNVNGGRVSVTGTTTAGYGIFVGVESASRGILTVENGGSIQAASIFIGGSNTSGAIYQNGGTSNPTNQLLVGRGGYGLYHLGDGSLSAAFGGNLDIASGANAVGVLTQTGGSAISSSLRLSHGGEIAVLHMTGGTHTTGEITLAINQFSTLGKRAEMTVADDAVLTFGSHINIGSNTDANAVFNVNGDGIIQTGSNSGLRVGNGLGGTRHVNFDGGTFRFTGASTFSTLATASPEYSIFLHDGGMNVEVSEANGRTAINQPLLAPTGDGVAGATYAIAQGGSGYVGAPVVTITGAPGATAVANMIDDESGNGTLRVASITITSPGINAVNPAFNFEDVPGATAADPVALSTAANVSGGLVKKGDGTVDINAINTYTGETRIEQGRIRLGSAGDISSSSAVNVLSGATFQILSPSGATVGGLAGSGTVQGVAGQAVNVLSLLAPGNSTGTLTISAGNLLVEDGVNYDFEVGGTTAAPSSDLVSLTGAGSTVGFTGDWTLSLVDLGLGDPTGLDFVLFSYAGDDPSSLGNWSIDYGSTLWSDGQIVLNSATNQIVLQGLTAVPEPSALALLGLAGLPMLRRRRK